MVSIVCHNLQGTHCFGMCSSQSTLFVQTKPRNRSSLCSCTQDNIQLFMEQTWVLAFWRNGRFPKKVLIEYALATCKISAQKKIIFPKNTEKSEQYLPLK